MNPATIRARIAASDGSDQGEILEAAFDVFFPDPLDDSYQGNIDHQKWQGLVEDFARFMEARAYTDAALLIAQAALPGWSIDIGEMMGLPLENRYRCHVRDHNNPCASTRRWVDSDKPTRALAIIDAVCAAVERKDEANG